MPRSSSSKPVTSRNKSVASKAIRQVFGKKSSIQRIPVVFQSILDNETPGVAFEIERLLTPSEVAREYAFRQKELNVELRRGEKLLAEWWPKLKRQKAFKAGHITGASVRFKTKFGHCISPLKVVIAINVRRKLSPEEMEVHSIRPLPTSVRFMEKGAGEFEVKVLEGTFRRIETNVQATFLRGSVLPQNPLSFSQPVVGGATIGQPNQDDDFGTLGIVYSFAAGEALALTCSHVVGGGPGVDQWGELNAAAAITKRSIAQVSQSRIDDIGGSFKETVDCATLEIQPASASLRYPAFPGAFIRNVNTPGAPFAGRVLYFAKSRVSAANVPGIVRKFGTALGMVAEGRVQASNGATYIIDGREFKNNFTVLDEGGNQVFVEPGDSGSVLVSEAEVNGAPALLAIGILFGKLQGNDSLGIACNMNSVLAALSTHIPKASQAKWTGSEWVAVP